MTAQTPWTPADRDWAEWLEEKLELEPGRHVEHFIVSASVGSGHADGQMRQVFVITCCRDTPQPTHLMEHVAEILGGRN